MVKYFYSSQFNFTFNAIPIKSHIFVEVGMLISKIHMDLPMTKNSQNIF